MAFPNVSYTREPVAKGYPGMIATTEPKWITSMIGEAGTGDIPFGTAVVYGATDDTVKKPTAGGKFAGIAVADRTVPAAQGSVFRQYDQFGCMRNGTIFVTALAKDAKADPIRKAMGDAAPAPTNVSDAYTQMLERDRNAWRSDAKKEA